MFYSCRCSGLDRVLEQRVWPLLPQLLLGLQVFPVLIQPAARGMCLRGPQIQELRRLTLVEFPEVLFLSLVDDDENTGNRSANSSDLGELGSHTASVSDTSLGQLPLQVFQLRKQLLLLAESLEASS